MVHQQVTDPTFNSTSQKARNVTSEISCWLWTRYDQRFLLKGTRIYLQIITISILIKWKSHDDNYVLFTNVALLAQKRSFRELIQHAPHLYIRHIHNLHKWEITYCKNELKLSISLLNDGRLKMETSTDRDLLFFLSCSLVWS